MAIRVGCPTSLFWILLFLHLSVFSSAHTACSASSTFNETSLCDTAPFPDLCYNSTSQIPSTVGHHPYMVARSLLGQCLVSANVATGQVNGVKHEISHSPANKCVNGMIESGTALGQAVSEFDRLGTPGSHIYGVRLGNVQSLAQTVISNTESCAASLQEVPGVKFLDVADTVLETMQMTSNALVFVDALATK